MYVYKYLYNVYVRVCMCVQIYNCLLIKFLCVVNLAVF